MTNTGINKTAIGFQIIKYLIVSFFASLIIIPLLILLFTAFKSDAEYTKTSVFALPSSFYIENFKYVWTNANFPLSYRNSFILVLLGAGGSILFGTMTAYVLGRFEFKMRKPILALYLSSAIIPSITFTITVFKMMRHLPTYNTIWGPIFLYIGTDILQIWIYLQFLSNISVSLDESAMIEGASYFKIWRSIILPLLIPATSTIFIIKAVGIYNDFFNQWLYMRKPHLTTVTTALTMFADDKQNLQHYMSAAITLAAVPTILLFLFLQKYIYAGITMGSSKE